MLKNFPMVIALFRSLLLASTSEFPRKASISVRIWNRFACSCLQNPLFALFTHSESMVSFPISLLMLCICCPLFWLSLLCVYVWSDPGSYGYQDKICCSAMVKNPPADTGDLRGVGLIPGSGRSLRRKWQPTPVFLPGKSLDRGAWWATVHGLQSQKQLSKHFGYIYPVCVYMCMCVCVICPRSHGYQTKIFSL